jgi:hypothetical protein
MQPSPPSLINKYHVSEGAAMRTYLPSIGSLPEELAGLLGQTNRYDQLL